MRKGILFAIAFTIVLTVANSSSANASAGWYPTYKGDLIVTEFCIPAGSHSPVFLQTMGEGSTWRTVAVIKFKKLSNDSYCRNEAKYGFTPAGLYHLKYKWNVNIRGSWGMQLYIPNLRKVVYGWPDGIEMTKGH
jgi:hypothetical protein